MKIKTIAFVILSTVVANVSAQKRDIELTDLKPYNHFNGKWVAPCNSMNDGERYTQVTDRNKIEAFYYKDGSSAGVIFDSDKIDNLEIKSIDGYAFSENEQKILIWTNTQPIYRRSYEADYFVYDIRYNELSTLTAEGGEQNAMLSPDGTMVAFVKNNNIFVKKLRYNTCTAITTDGEINKIINGVPDWVYEEEFSMSSAMEWSPDSKELAYIRYDESEVEEYSFPLYKASYPEYPEFATYPGQYTYKYPKAGEKNSEVCVKVYNISSKQTKTMDLGDMKKQYIPRIKWTAQEGKLGIVKMNRRQNILELYIANTSSTVCKSIFEDRNSRYVDEIALDNFFFTQDGESFIYLGEKDGWNHIYMYGINGIEKAKLTNGNWDVTRIYGYDEKTKTLYYQAARTSSANRDIYGVSIDGKKEIKIAEAGTNNAVFSKTFKYLWKSHSDTKTPTEYTICNNVGKTIWTIESNDELKNTLSKYNMHYKEFFTFNTPDGTELRGWMIKPSDFDATKQYPVLMYQYSGPGSQEVLNEWKVDWEQVLANNGYIMVCVDGRGTGSRGEEFKKCTYGKLGKLESDDQIATAKHLASLPYVDGKRIGIWGWSFGGFMTSLSMCKSDVFKMGIAVAPVTNWRFYDTIYTERFLTTPEENSTGYDTNSPLYLAENLNGRLFLIHGTADDNVHYQNQMEFVDALVRSGKQFDMFTYPNKNHSIYGGKTRLHLYTMMLNYVMKNL